MQKNHGEKRGYISISAITLLCCIKMWKKLISNDIFETGSYFGSQLVEEHEVDNLNQMPTSRSEIRSQPEPEPIMTIIDLDLEQTKVKG